LEVLEWELGGSAPPGVAEHDSAHLEHVAAAVADTGRRQAAEAAAGDQALPHVPRLLHAAIREVTG
jgi:hypothetical protein